MVAIHLFCTECRKTIASLYGDIFEHYLIVFIPQTNLRPMHKLWQPSHYLNIVEDKNIERFYLLGILIRYITIRPEWYVFHRLVQIWWAWAAFVSERIKMQFLRESNLIFENENLMHMIEYTLIAVDLCTWTVYIHIQIWSVINVWHQLSAHFPIFPWIF